MPRGARALVLLCLAALLAACASNPLPADLTHRLEALLPTDALLVGEQHDAAAHQRLHQAIVETLSARGVLAAVALEMAEQGHSTAALERNARETNVREALQWNEAAWPWDAYGPAVMTAVRAGVPVLGANLPRATMAPAMGDTALDRLLPGPALKAQQQRIREGHCGLLPETQVSPMTRIQVARDVAMAQTTVAARVPGKTVLLLAGAGHVDSQLGVPQHLPAELKVKTLLLLANAAQDAPETIANYNQIWPTLPAPAKDYCAEFRAQSGRLDAGPPTPAPN